VLLLLTVGLLLIGLVTLVIGFLNSSLALDYISIAASALSFALVLLFTRLGRARSARSAAARGRQAPAPLAPRDAADTSMMELDTADTLGPETAAYPRATTTPRAEPPTSEVFDDSSSEEEYEAEEAEWEPEPAPPVSSRTAPVSSRAARGRSPYERPSVPSVEEAAPVAPAPVARFDHDRVSDDRFDDDPVGDDRFDHEDIQDASDEGGGHPGGYEDLEFPIADYDELRVAEILPLLEELEPDEMEIVRDREMAGRNRAVVLRKLDELSGGAVAPGAGRRPATPVINGTRQRPAAERPAEVGYDDDAGYGRAEDYGAEDGGAQNVAFPIADYDDLRLTEILPLLPQLEPVELEMVRQRELEGERRATLLNRIDALIGTGPTRAPARQGR
jgi:hypothetical protein